MTAPPAGGSTCLTARGRDISLAALQRQDPCINNILDLASQVALYTFNSRTNEWEKTDVEGTLFVYTRLASPRHGFTIMNRLSMENLTEPITKDLDFQLQDPFLLYRNARMTIHGIWFYDKEDCQRIAQKMKILTQQEQALAQSQSGWLSPGKERGAGNAGEGKAVDILQMLTKARSEYDKVGKSSSEPKEIGGSSMLYGNPNLIKPIPVKPNTQDGEGGEPRSLSLATLFGSPLTQPKAVPVSALSPTATRPLATGSKPGGRPPVARSLSYDDPVISAGSAAPQADQGPIILGSDSVVKAMRQGQMACEAIGIGGPVVVRGALMGEVEAQSGIRDAVGLRASIAGAPGAVTPNVAGVPLSPNPQHQHQQNQIVHCAAIQKLIQGQRGTGGLSGALQTLSESPENRLCENGVPLEHHHHLHHQHLQHQHLQHLHHQLNHQNHLLQYQPNHQPQQLLDPIQRLLQAQSHGPASSPSSAPPCCANPPPLQQPPLIPSLQPAQPVTLDSGAYSHSQHNQTIFFSPSKPHTETQHNSQSAGVTPHLPGVAPHELLQKLQLVQQEQSQTSHDAPRLCPGLAPRFQGAAPTQSPGLVLGTGSQPCMPFQVISPQRIPATVAPTMLLSPSVFSQSKPPTGGVLVPSQDSCSAPPSISRPPLQEEFRVLTRSQLQATMLHLIQTDGSFLDSIYEAYVGRLPQDGSSSRY